MSIYDERDVARALLAWAKYKNGKGCFYLEDRMYAVADEDMVIILIADSYDEAIRKAKARATQGDCENCDFRKFSETFIDGVVEVMNKNGITSVEQLSVILKGGAE